MMTLIVAAAVAAQPVPPADPHGQMAGMQPAQAEGMKDCCKDGCKCCKDMAGKPDGHAEHGGHSAQ